MEGIFTNRNGLKDFVNNGLRKAGLSVTEVYMAVAFVTEADFVRDLVNRSVRVRMVVRLGFPTSPKVLRTLYGLPGVEIRFFTGDSFHPKLFIFGNKEALLGSANLTRSALTVNQEIMVSVSSNDARFDELAALFSAYWEEAAVLSLPVIDAYETSFNKVSRSMTAVERLEEEIGEAVGHHVFSNIERGIPKKSKETVFLESYRKTYQESVSAFEAIRKVYEELGLRKADSEAIPLRLEIDSFFSFVRDVHATHESWQETPIGWTDERKALLIRHIKEWLETKREHFEHQIVHVNYPSICRTFASPEAIASASMEDIVDTLVVLHSFHDRLRFFSGGLDALKLGFAQSNEIGKVRGSLSYLLFGGGEVVKRMADLIFDPEYKLNEFGTANVQELVGWINEQDLPVVNGRTTKVLRYYGFKVRQL